MVVKALTQGNIAWRRNRGALALYFGFGLQGACMGVLKAVLSLCPAVVPSDLGPLAIYFLATDIWQPQVLTHRGDCIGLADNICAATGSARTA